MWLIVLPALLAVSHSGAADAGPRFDETKRVVLPSEAATTILKWYVAAGNWTTEDWPVSVGDLDRFDLAHAIALTKANFGWGPPNPLRLYRQYIPARWKGLRVIVVNGFDEAILDMEKLLDKSIDPAQWKRELLVSYGGGCLQWRAVYIVEQNRFMVLHHHIRRAPAVCNAPK